MTRAVWWGERETMNRVGKCGFGLRKSASETGKRLLIHRFAFGKTKREQDRTIGN
jgi:hypothetical protein